MRVLSIPTGKTTCTEIRAPLRQGWSSRAPRRLKDMPATPAELVW
jgi:hypothetical protein